MIAPAMLTVLQYPWLLALAIVLPAMAVALTIVAARRRRVRLARLGTPALVSRLVPPSATRAPWPRATVSRYGPHYQKPTSYHRAKRPLI